jgi:hypothetical protein
MVWNIGIMRYVELEHKVMLTRPLTKSIQIGGIFCDLTKTFDCVNRDNIIRELEEYAIIGSSPPLQTGDKGSIYHHKFWKKKIHGTIILIS